MPINVLRSRYIMCTRNFTTLPNTNLLDFFFRWECTEECGKQIDSPSLILVSPSVIEMRFVCSLVASVHLYPTGKSHFFNWINYLFQKPSSLYSLQNITERRRRITQGEKITKACHYHFVIKIPRRQLLAFYFYCCLCGSARSIKWSSSKFKILKAH